MTFSQAVDNFKNRSIPTNWLQPVKRGFKCIGCGNGSGNDGTGASLSNDGTRLLCGKCGKAFSYIDVAAFHYGFDISNFSDAVKKLCEIENIQLNFSNETSLSSDEIKLSHDKKTIDDETLKQKNATANFLSQSHGKLKDFLDRQGGKWRGLSYDVLNFLHWEYCENYKHTNNNFSFPAILIPNDNGGLLARQVNGNSKSNLKPSGSSTIYLPKNPKFILTVEGSINGASILQACGLNLDFAIFAANGTPNIELIFKKICALFPQKIPVAIAFDNDSNGAGQKAAENLLKTLSKASFTACIVDITKTPDQDLNDLLNANNGTFKLANMVNDAIAHAQTEFQNIQHDKEKKLFGLNATDYLDIHFQNFIDDNKKFANRKTGFSNLDDEMHSFQPGIYILGGLPALGKTSFALQLLHQLARQGENCIFCSYEMSAGFLFSKLLAFEVCRLETNDFNRSIINPDDNLRLHPLTATKISNGNFYEHEKFYLQAKQNLRESLKNFRIWELNDVNISSLLSRLESFCSNFARPPIVVIDYIQILAMNGNNPKTAIDSALHDIINCRRKTNITFLIVSSLNRANYNTDISYESFKETGTLEFSADVIWGLQLETQGDRNHQSIQSAKNENPRFIQLLCLKNRFGSNFDIGFKYYPAVDLFLPNDEYGEFTDYQSNDSGQLVARSKKNVKAKYF